MLDGIKVKISVLWENLIVPNKEVIGMITGLALGIIGYIVGSQHLDTWGNPFRYAGIISGSCIFIVSLALKILADFSEKSNPDDLLPLMSEVENDEEEDEISETTKDGPTEEKRPLSTTSISTGIASGTPPELPIPFPSAFDGVSFALPSFSLPFSSSFSSKCDWTILTPDEAEQIVKNEKADPLKFQKWLNENGEGFLNWVQTLWPPGANKPPSWVAETLESLTTLQTANLPTTAPHVSLSSLPPKPAPPPVVIPAIPPYGHIRSILEAWAKTNFPEGVTKDNLTRFLTAAKLKFQNFTEKDWEKLKTFLEKKFLPPLIPSATAPSPTPSASPPEGPKPVASLTPQGIPATTGSGSPVSTLSPPTPSPAASSAQTQLSLPIHGLFNDWILEIWISKHYPPTPSSPLGINRQNFREMIKKAKTEKVIDVPEEFWTRYEAWLETRLPPEAPSATTSASSPEGPKPVASPPPSPPTPQGIPATTGSPVSPLSPLPSPVASSARSSPSPIPVASSPTHASGTSTSSAA